MKKSVIIVLVLFSIFLYACEEETYLTCPDNVTQVFDLESCPVPKPVCPECDDGDACTFDTCSVQTNYECTFENVTPCDGNNLCEEGEFPWSSDCPNTCDDNNTCTEDTYSYFSKGCMNEDIIPCCSNSFCEAGETFLDCPIDCEQLVSIKVTNYQRVTRIGYVEIDLTGSDFVYLLVEFKIKNLLMDDEETLNYKQANGYYYDPYKMRIIDSEENFYDVEYDSDLLVNWRDYDIIPKGHTVGASLLFIIPRDARGIRFIAYDKFSRKLDMDEIF